jgi:DASH complex subunit Duo1
LQRIAGQLEQTDALLNKYINVLAKSEEFSRLIFNENWMGADAVSDNGMCHFEFY